MQPLMLNLKKSEEKGLRNKIDLRQLNLRDQNLYIERKVKLLMMMKQLLLHQKEKEVQRKIRIIKIRTIRMRPLQQLLKMELNL
jgi:hypothetical protein